MAEMRALAISDDEGTVVEKAFEPTSNPIVDLPAKLRHIAAGAERTGRAFAAEIYRDAAGVAEEAILGHLVELLTITQAATETGFTARGLRKMVDRGELQGYRRLPGGPLLVVRADLPRKPSCSMVLDGIGAVPVHQKSGDHG